MVLRGEIGTASFILARWGCPHLYLLMQSLEFSERMLTQ